jgi:hypothetical protein
MAFTYRKDTGTWGYADGVSKKFTFDFKKQIDADTQCPNEISSIEVKQIGQNRYYPEIDENGSTQMLMETLDVQLNKISAHGTIVEVEFTTVPHASTPAALQIQGEEYYSFVYISMTLVFNLE